jgi:hypothetical protein
VRDRRWSSLALQYALVNLVCILVWAFSGAQIHHFWPKWVLLGTLIMYFRRLGHRSGRRELPPSGERYHDVDGCGANGERKEVEAR